MLLSEVLGIYSDIATKFAMLEKGPYIMKLKALEEKLNRIESNR